MLSISYTVLHGSNRPVGSMVQISSKGRRQGPKCWGKMHRIFATQNQCCIAVFR